MLPNRDSLRCANYPFVRLNLIEQGTRRVSAGPLDHENLLPVLSAPRATAAPLSPPLRWAVRLSRLFMLVAAAGLLFTAQRRFDSTLVSTDVTFDEAASLFPTAARFGPRDASRRGQTVLDSTGQALGIVLKTSPETDHLIGYSGPSNLIVGLDPVGAIVGVKLISSRDTPEHVEQVRRNKDFWDQLQGWNPAADGDRPIHAVSGSTLTSLAMVESLPSRLNGRATSLRFPDKISLAEVQAVFPQATHLKEDSMRPSWLAVLDQSEVTIGYILRTSPFAENVRGYSGPTEALVAVDKSRKNVAAVRLRSSFDTLEYVDRVRTDDGFLKSLAGRNIEDWSRLDFAAAGIEGVSGATQTSYGVSEGIRRRLQAEQQTEATSPTTHLWKPRDFGLIAVILGGLAITFVPALGGRRIRAIWQVLLVAAFGLWLGDMLSVSLVAGWSRHGVAWSTAPGLVVLVAVALVVPWGTRRQVYCHALCPHGAVQEWLGRGRTLHVRLPRWLSRSLGLIPGGLLVAALFAAFLRPSFNLAQIEPFDAWVLGTGAAVSLAIAVIGLVASLFVPQAYCRFGCPTGALLKFARSHGTAERWGVRDLLALMLIILAASWMCWPTLRPIQPAGPLPTAVPAMLTGRAFGTTWTVKVRDHLSSATTLQDDVAAELERIEARLSNWRPGSETSQFNASQTTLEIECTPELASLVKQARDLSAATDGEFDITVAPLVDAWGYGPSGPKTSPPEDETITRLLKSVGWKKLELDESVPSLRKLDPALQIDLGALLQGYAVDHVHQLLQQRGLKDYLVEVGGELRAAGAWSVALDPAAGDWVFRDITLIDKALSTSGTYRQPAGGSGETRHIISPKTGRPTTTPWKAVAVLASTCRDADGWDTALLLSQTAEQIATARHLDVQLVPRTGTPVSTGTAWMDSKRP